MVDLNKGNEKPAANSNPYTMTTLGEWGNRLIVGFNNGVDVVPAFRLMETDELIEAHGRRKNERNIAIAATRTLAYVTVKLGSIEFASFDSDTARETQIRHLNRGDAFTLWFLARNHIIENPFFDLEGIVCPCKWRADGPVRFNTLDADMRVCEPGANLEYRVTVPSPIEIGGRKYTEFMGRPVSWQMVEEFYDEGNKLPREMLEIMHSHFRPVVDGKVDEGRYINRTTKLRQPHIDALSKEVAARNPGPVLNTFVDCPKCPRRIVVGYDWRYDSFFVTSSLTD